MSYKYNYDYDEKPYVTPKLKTDRNVWRFIILGILTLGLYELMFFIPLSFDLDKVSPPRERTKTMNYLTAWILSLFTFKIVIYIWHYMFVSRVADALAERDIAYKFDTGDFWSWCVLGSLILIGPYVYVHKLCKAMNLLCESYNENNAV